MVRTTLAEAFGDGAAVWLFGSRARGDLRGDVDLLVECPRAVSLPVTLATRRRLEGALHQKVDLIVRGPDDQRSAIDAIAKETGVML
ncbi:MAG: nucleotidyltransferase domain-containing protein [Magnetospirillum sp.]|nr:nucleotidyltransferase domain-containing protein [Magnetospirillum sp.]